MNIPKTGLDVNGSNGRIEGLCHRIYSMAYLLNVDRINIIPISWPELSKVLDFYYRVFGFACCAIKFGVLKFNK